MRLFNLLYNFLSRPSLSLFFFFHLFFFFYSSSSIFFIGDFCSPVFVRLRLTRTRSADFLVAPCVFNEMAITRCIPTLLLVKKQSAFVIANHSTSGCVTLTTIESLSDRWHFAETSLSSWARQLAKAYYRTEGGSMMWTWSRFALSLRMACFDLIISFTIADVLNWDQARVICCGGQASLLPSTGCSLAPEKSIHNVTCFQGWRQYRH